MSRSLITVSLITVLLAACAPQTADGGRQTAMTTRPPDYATTRPPDHATTRPSDHATTRPPDHATTRPTDYATTTPTPTLAPAVQSALDLLYTQQAPYALKDGQIVIDDYAAAGRQEIALAPETVKVTPTHDGLNPAILTALDQAGRLYAFNPDHGWFAVPEVQTDYHVAIKENKYTPATQDYFEDGRANIVHALLYAQNPDLPAALEQSPWWVSYEWASNILEIAILPLGNGGMGYYEYPERYAVSEEYFQAYRQAKNLRGFYRVTLKNGEVVYVVATIANNPSATDPSRLSNFFLGFDQKTWEALIQGRTVDGRKGLHLEDLLDATEQRGFKLFAIILIPPAPLPDGTSINPLPNLDGYGWQAPVMTSLYPLGKLIRLFPPQDQDLIYQVFKAAYGKPGQSTAPLPEVPPRLSRYILPAFFNYW